MTGCDDNFESIQQQLKAERSPRAKEALRKFLQDHPKHPEALDLFGQIACEQGQYDEATDAIEQAIALRPDVAHLHHHLGYVYFVAGKVDQAIAAYRRGLAIDANDAQTQNNLGVALKAKGNFAEAIAAFQSASRLSPELAFPQRNLAEVLRLQGKLDQAIVHYQQALQLSPADAESHNGLGLVFSMQVKLDEAVAQFEEAIRIKPDYDEAENNLGTLLKATERFQEAVALYERVLRRRPDFVTARVNLGSVLIELGQFDEAIKHLEYALQINPNHAVAFHNLGDLALTDQYVFSADQLERIKSLVANHKGQHEETSALHFTLAGILDKQQHHDDAFEAYLQANHAQYRVLKAAGAAFDPASHHQKVQQTIDVFGRDFFQNKTLFSNSLDTEIPVVVVGMPRSGTTLLEQIIASHPHAAGAGELEAIEQLIPQVPALLNSGQEYPDCFSRAEAPAVRSIAQDYLNRLTANRHDAGRVVDKTWYNFYYLGLIALLCPRARIIHCRREAMDVGISCFFSNFNSIPWATRLEDIGAFYRSYEQLMKHWQKVLPLRMYEVSYEQLVADHETVSREMIDFCGLEWSDRCLEFYKNRRPVQTASRVQVRQPIYKTSIGRWKKYESHLAPLRESLRGAGIAEETLLDDCAS